ncbi:MAG: hypothetical protein AAGA85_14390, partial [Bacteroidota bacterium]
AIDDLRPGDTLRLTSGIYQGPFTISVNGTPMQPIVITSASRELDQLAVIDGGATRPGMELQNHWMLFRDASWIEIHHLQFQNGWTDPIRVENSSYLSFKSCDMVGGRRVIRAQGEGTHHVLVENCFWDQGGRYSWDVTEWEGEDAWTSMHHGQLAFLNGSLFACEGTSGGHVIRGNTIRNAFNAIRWRAKQGMDKNIEIYENTIEYVRDNDFEPEDYAANLFIHHNRSHNVHKTLSIDHVNGGGIYYFGNVITTDLEERTAAIATGYHKIYGNEDQHLSDTLYLFNNSFYGTGRIHGSIGDRTILNVVHQNNAYELTQRKWELDQWNESLRYDYDCSSRPFSTVLTANRQEANGLVKAPGFQNPLTQDLTLREDSPCVDAGAAISIEGLRWQQTFEGDAPDIGAFDGNRPIVGPFFRVRDSPVPEHPRVTNVTSDEDSTQISFSTPLQRSSMTKNIMSVNASGLQQPLTDFVLVGQGHTVRFANPDSEVESYAVGGQLKGTNGMTATHWASDAGFQPRREKDLAIVLLYATEGGRVKMSEDRRILRKGSTIELSAQAEPGYRFVGWEGNYSGTDKEVSISLKNSVWIVARFEK